MKLAPTAGDALCEASALYGTTELHDEDAPAMAVKAAEAAVELVKKNSTEPRLPAEIVLTVCNAHAASGERSAFDAKKKEELRLAVSHCKEYVSLVRQEGDQVQRVDEPTTRPQPSLRRPGHSLTIQEGAPQQPVTLPHLGDPSTHR